MVMVLLGNDQLDIESYF